MSDTFPAMEAMRSVQPIAAGDGPTVYTALWLASIDSEGLLRVKYRDRRARDSGGNTLPNLRLGDYVLVDRVPRQGKHSKSMSTSTGPWRVANDGKEPVYAMQYWSQANWANARRRGCGFKPMTSTISQSTLSRCSSN